MRYLLDTNIITDLIRNPKGRVAKRVRAVGRQAVCTSVIVAAELRFGVAKNPSLRLETRVNEALQALDVAPFETPADVTYGAIRASLERQGRPIGGSDLFIAAHAITLGCTLVTANEREFARIEGLKCENWL
ncbi:MAG: type II toxin-antitoxin system VapC family toxin [Rhodomicrobium sp.]